VEGGCGRRRAPGRAAGQRPPAKAAPFLRPRAAPPTQVGEGKADHNLWRRAEDVKEQRPAYVCTPSKPGSDVAAAMAAALAATAVAFKGRDPAYADRTLAEARKLYE
jgi:hypothetical protein